MLSGIILRLVHEGFSQILIFWRFLLKLTCELQVRHRLIASPQVDGLVSSLLIKVFHHYQVLLDCVLICCHETFVIFSVWVCELGRLRVLGRSWLNDVLLTLLAELAFELQLLQMEQIIALSRVLADVVDSSLFQILI